MTIVALPGNNHHGRALWYAARGIVDLRPVELHPPGSDEVMVRMLFSGISRGTERLILDGAVPEAEWQRMRAPLQEGDFPFPVKYGYCGVGLVEQGPEDLIGRTIFCLHPHQDCFLAPAAMAVPLPDGVPARRAVLGANMETALNALWDAVAGPADRIVVVGAGILGRLLARLCVALPGAQVTLVDVAEERRAIARHLGVGFAPPDQAPLDADLVFHTSASTAGLQTALRLAGQEARVVEMSWYGDRPVAVTLGGAFHSRRLSLISSQVGQVSASRRPRWTYRRRLEAALGLLDDPALDMLLGEDLAFEDAPARLPDLLRQSGAALPPVIRYPAP